MTFLKRSKKKESLLAPPLEAEIKNKNLTKKKGKCLTTFHLGHVHRPGQEVGGHVADEDHAVCFRYEVVLHAVHRLVAAVVNIGGFGV